MIRINDVTVKAPLDLTFNLDSWNTGVNTTFHLVSVPTGQIWGDVYLHMWVRRVDGLQNFTAGKDVSYPFAPNSVQEMGVPATNNAGISVGPLTFDEGDALVVFGISTSGSPILRVHVNGWAYLI